MSSLLFSPLTIRGVTIPNRVVMPPLCQYSAIEGLANDWHMVQLGRFAVGGFGLIFTEVTSVMREGRITHGDLGLWSDAHIEPVQRLARFIKDRYAEVLLSLGFSVDFYGDILKDLKGYQVRFAKDVARMNSIVRAAGIPPIVGMPLDQIVVEDGRGHRISRLGEEIMRGAGFDVISLDGYYNRYNGRSFTVSRWEGHPDEEANAVFASMFYERLRVRQDVQRYQKNGPKDSPGR